MGKRLRLSVDAIGSLRCCVRLRDLSRHVAGIFCIFSSGAVAAVSCVEQVTIFDDEMRSSTLINYQNCTSNIPGSAHAAGVIANLSVISRSYFGNIIPADSGDMFVVQIREKVRTTTQLRDIFAMCHLGLVARLGGKGNGMSSAQLCDV